MKSVFNSSADELLLTEMLFAGHFNQLEPAQVVALLSCFVAEGSKSNGEPPKISENLQAILRQCQDLAKKIAFVSRECEVPIDENAYVNGLKPDLMEICFTWCNGASFATIIKDSSIYEGLSFDLYRIARLCNSALYSFCQNIAGSIVRSMRLLEELMRQMAAAAKVIGNVQLEEKFTAGKFQFFTTYVQYSSTSKKASVECLEISF